MRGEGGDGEETTVTIPVAADGVKEPLQFPCLAEGRPMNLTWLRASFAFLWLLIGLGLVFREYLFPALGVDEGANSNWTLAGIMALVFAGWNLFRIVIGNPSRRAPQSRAVAGALPLQRRDEPVARPREYLPELDFTKQTRADGKNAE